MIVRLASHFKHRWYKTGSCYCICQINALKATLFSHFISSTTTTTALRIYYIRIRTWIEHFGFRCVCERERERGERSLLPRVDDFIEWTNRNHSKSFHLNFYFRSVHLLFRSMFHVPCMSFFFSWTFSFFFHSYPLHEFNNKQHNFQFITRSLTQMWIRILFFQLFTSKIECVERMMMRMCFFVFKFYPNFNLVDYYDY